MLQAQASRGLHTRRPGAAARSATATPRNLRCSCHAGARRSQTLSSSTASQVDDGAHHSSTVVPPTSPMAAAQLVAAGAASLLLTCAGPSVAAAPAAAPGLLSDVQQQQKQQPVASSQLFTSVPSAPQLQQQQPAVAEDPTAGAAAQELHQLAVWDKPRVHWLATVVGILAVNVLGLQAVLKLLQASRDSSTPMTVLTCRMGLRVDNGSSNKLQERLHFLRGMMGGGSPFFTFEEAIQAICNPPRGCQLAYADLQVSPTSSKQAGYDLFKQVAMQEVVRAQQEESDRVLKVKPEGPNHRNILQKLMGAAETQDAESSQACLMVTLVVLAKGTFLLPQQPLKNLAAFKDTMKSLCGHLKIGQLLAVELLMTPDSPEDFLSEAQLMADYPVLTDLSSGLKVTSPDWSPSPFSSVDGGDVATARQTWTTTTTTTTLPGQRWQQQKQQRNGGQAATATAASEAAAAMAAMAADAAGAEGAASAAAAAAAATGLRDEQLA